ncbi:unnamed protein product [Callosobruchus maculatus]|uniref:Uncharacterized protein n=1 Tax=Callosobruchus maculatus TaxID=64391 RepID=A0A653CGA4_CALMS|nr:unnamed protein product [Callosobruchus maculatus]
MCYWNIDKGIISLMMSYLHIVLHSTCGEELILLTKIVFL